MSKVNRQTVVFVGLAGEKIASKTVPFLKSHGIRIDDVITVPDMRSTRRRQYISMTLKISADKDLHPNAKMNSYTFDGWFEKDNPEFFTIRCIDVQQVEKGHEYWDSWQIRNMITDAIRSFCTRNDVFEEALFDVRLKR